VLVVHNGAIPDAYTQKSVLFLDENDDQLAKPFDDFRAQGF